MRSTICSISSLVRSWKTMTSSTRLRNSGRKSLLELAGHALLDDVVADVRRVALDGTKPSDWPLDDVASADVARHDDDRVLEVDLATLGVGEATLFEDLQQDVEDVRVRLLDLVEEDDRVGLAADLLGELAALVEADVARRRADEAARPCASPCTRTCRAEISASSLPNRKSASALDSSVLPTPDGPRKMNEPLGRFGFFRPARVRRIALLTRPMTASSWPTMRSCSDRLHAQELGGLLFGQRGDRDAGPHRHDLGDLLLGDLDDAAGVGLEPLLFHRALLGEDLLLLVAQRGGLLELLRLDRGFLLGCGPARRRSSTSLTPGRRGHHLDAHLGAGLVDEVDGLVGQEAVGDVAVGEVRGRVDGVVGDA